MGSSGIVTDGIVRKSYDGALSNQIEYTSSAFWQVLLQHLFPELQTYAAVCEYSPDESRRRCDITVLMHDGNHNTLSSLIWQECKRPSEDIPDAVKSLVPHVHISGEVDCEFRRHGVLMRLSAGRNSGVFRNEQLGYHDDDLRWKAETGGWNLNSVAVSERVGSGPNLLTNS